MTGIYKITSPTNRVYIGQSVDIEKRLKWYKRKSLKSQIRLKRSFEKYGVENHIFEVKEQCSIDSLNERERYWQDYYNVTDIGLNCRLTGTKDKSGKLSSETILKMKTASIGRNISPEAKEKSRLSNLGSNRPDYIKQKISNTMKGLKKSDEHKTNLGIANLGKKRTPEQAAKKSKILLNLETGIYYVGVKEAAYTIDTLKTTLTNKLNGGRINNTNFIYV